jgi:hypothetical protein
MSPGCRFARGCDQTVTGVICPTKKGPYSGVPSSFYRRRFGEPDARAGGPTLMYSIIQFGKDIRLWLLPVRDRRALMQCNMPSSFIYR